VEVTIVFDHIVVYLQSLKPDVLFQKQRRHYRCCREEVSEAKLSKILAFPKPSNDLKKDVVFCFLQFNNSVCVRQVKDFYSGAAFKES